MIDLAQVLLLGVGALLLTTVLAPLTMTLLHRWQVIDHPSHRSSHVQPTLRGGGLAVLGGVLGCSTAAHSLGAEMPLVALVGVLALTMLGLAADTTDIGPLVRFVAQAFAGAALGSLIGDYRTALLGAIAMPVLVNAVNFMDGINGITALTMSAWAVIVLFAGSTSAAVILAALTLGGALGFLPWNLPRARMFLGDSGSYLFGGFVTLALMHEQAGGGYPLVVIAAMVPYLFDTGLTLVRRAARGERLTEAHREHFYQRLSRRPGWGHIPVAALFAVLALSVGASAAFLVGQNGVL
ncbi:lipopolysaccharide biosynthesis protein [Ornithinimicrobium sufpigmenti]|uniref:lipopolysaccharide biosynthesis protein n=1 Tax=Ornithinimicrobium sufpigmenti TaxID=2508882 RepID=UPI00103633BB|nr:MULTISPECIES: lipopolysaccharide biosynthesis protein [unclassified Ornithinimicrobium]